MKESPGIGEPRIKRTKETLRAYRLLVAIISRYPKTSKFVVLMWIVSMTPHIFGVARARVRSADVAVLSQWLKGEILQVDPDAELASVILLAANKHPTDRTAFLADVLEDSSLLQVLSVSTVDELLLRFDARKETSCSLPVKTMPVVGQADSASSGITNRYLSLDSALAERSDRDHLRDSRPVIDQVESRLSDYAECEHVVQPRGP